MQDNKNYKISNLRAVAIISVVIGHSIILYSHQWNIIPTDIKCDILDKFKDVINLYQMELYFFISGFLFFNSVQKRIPIRTFLKKKALRLLIPYLFFGLCYMIPIKLLLQIPTIVDQNIISILLKYLLGIDNGHLWFLYSLFLMFGIYQ